MKTLANPQDAREIIERLQSLSPGDTRRWGKMSVGEAVCHLRESYRTALGERSVAPLKMPIPGRAIKFIALSLPVRWLQGSPTLPEIEAGKGLMPPAAFEQDHAELLAAHDRFIAMSENRHTHPIFGSMQPSDWMRWGYLHTDHHLRQFGR